MCSVLIFGASARPAYALLGVGDASVTIGDIPRTLWNIFSKISQSAGSRAFHQALRSVTYRLAQQSAVWIASGDRGKKPLIFTKNWDDELLSIGNEVAGKFLVNVSSSAFPVDLCSPGSIQNRMRFTSGLTDSITEWDPFKDIRNPYGEINKDTGKTACSLSDIGSNIKQAGQSKYNELAALTGGYEPGKNELSSFMMMREYLKRETEIAEKNKEAERTHSGVAPPKTATGQPSGTTKEQVTAAQQKALDKALDPDVQSTGDIFADTFALFTNTLTQTYLKRLQAGFINPRSSRSSDSLASQFDGSGASRAALLADYDVFSPSKSLNISTPGEINLFSDMVSCPPSQYQTPYNCLLNDGMQSATKNYLTLHQAVKNGLIDANLQFPQEHSPDLPNLSLLNLRKLRFLRVIPLGWEIAAERLASPVSFGELLRCFEDPNNKNDSTMPVGCPDDESGNNLLYHLVDPNWVLELPQQYCRAQGYGTIPEHEASPNRQEVCVDLQSCISEDENGNCAAFGYCTRERVKWQIDAKSCEPQFATCTTFTKPDRTKVSWLASSINSDECESSNAGCKWYSMSENSTTVVDDPPVYQPTPKIYLTSSALTCRESEKNTKEIIPLDEGINIIKNGDFNNLQLEAGAVRPLSEGGWIFGGAKLWPADKDVIYDGDAIKPDQAIQQVTIKPFTFYTLSFYVQKNGVNDTSLVKITNANNNLINVSFPQFGGTYENRFATNLPSVGLLEIQIPILNESVNRYAATFYHKGIDPDNIIINLGDETFYDNIQLEEININDGSKAVNLVQEFVDAGNESLESLNEITSGNIQQASPTTSFKEYDDNPRIAFKNASACVTNDEVSARKYTLTNSSPEIEKIARLNPAGLCPAECDGLDQYLEMPTAIEKLRTPDILPTLSDLKSFIPEKARSCTLDDVGCESFTNTKTEQVVYYNEVQSCVLDTNGNISTFYTWEGGQLKTWQLLKDDNTETGKGNGPCTVFRQGLYETTSTPVDTDTESCGDPSGGSPGEATLSCGAEGVLCRTFIDEDNNEYIRDANLIVTASNQCTEFRRTDEYSTNQEKWYFIPSQAVQCSPSALGCREYKGKDANKVNTLIEEDFEDGFRARIGELNWWTIDGDATPLLSVSEADAINGTYSLKSSVPSNSIQLNTALTEKTGTHNFTGNSYEIRFLAKAIDPSIKITGAHFTTAAGGDEWFFRGIGSPNTSAGDPPDILVPQEWRNYQLGPLFWPRADQPSFLRITFSGGEVLIDDFELVEIPNKYYRINSTVEEESNQGLQPDVCYEPTVELDPSTEFNSCHQYDDDRNNTYYVAKFDKLFPKEALSCIAVIDTHNSDSPYGQEFNIDAVGNDANDDYLLAVADEVSYKRILDTNKTDNSNAGCTELGLPTSATTWETVYKIIDPDNFEGMDMCKIEEEGCEKFIAQDYGDEVFRDPGVDVCTWDAEDGVFKEPDGTTTCGTSSVRECPKEQHSCSAYKPFSDGLSEGEASVLYKLQRQVKNIENECTEEDTTLGCINFYENYTTPTIPWITEPNKLSAIEMSPNSDQVLPVVQRRECSEWLTPSTYSEADDEKARTKRTITYDLGRCQRLDLKGSCDKWVTTTSPDYPEAYYHDKEITVFDSALYTNRYTGDKTLYNGAWDYSGYSIPTQFPIEHLKEFETSIYERPVVYRGVCPETGYTCTGVDIRVDDGHFSDGFVGNIVQVISGAGAGDNRFEKKAIISRVYDSYTIELDPLQGTEGITNPSNKDYPLSNFSDLSGTTFEIAGTGFSGSCTCSATGDCTNRCGTGTSAESKIFIYKGPFNTTYAGLSLRVTSGSNIGEVRKITSFGNSAKLILDRGFDNDMANATFEILGRPEKAGESSILISAKTKEYEVVEFLPDDSVDIGFTRLEIATAPFTAGEKRGDYVLITRGPIKGEVRLIDNNGTYWITLENPLSEIPKADSSLTPPRGSSSFKIVKASEVSCRSFPEEDSPFSSKKVSRDLSTGSFIFNTGTRALENVNLCEEGDSCECSYKKAKATGETKYYSMDTSLSLSDDLNSVTDVLGWDGYCMEYDADTMDPEGNNACLAWWPVDSVMSKSNIFNNNPEAGFVNSDPLYYCLNAQSNGLSDVEEFGIRTIGVKDGKYVLEVPFVKLADTGGGIDKATRVNFSPIISKYRGAVSWFSWESFTNNPFFNNYLKYINPVLWLVDTYIGTDQSNWKPLPIMDTAITRVSDLARSVRDDKDDRVVAIAPFSFLGYVDGSDNYTYDLGSSCESADLNNIYSSCKSGTVDNQEYSIDSNGWAGESGIIPFPVNTSVRSDIGNKISPIAGLHEYDIEKIILQPVAHGYSDWPKSDTKIVLQRDGWAKQVVGGNSIETEAGDSWSAFWCYGNSCDFDGKYTWNDFSKYITRGTITTVGLDPASSLSVQNSLGCSALDDGTNMLAVRAIFADENGNMPPEYWRRIKLVHAQSQTAFVDAFSTKPTGHEPYAFLGLEGGLCDNTGSEGWVPMSIFIYVREYCTDFALVNKSGENKAWSGRLNNMSQVASGICSVTTGKFCYDTSDCPSGEECNKIFDSAGKQGFFVNTFSGLDGGAYNFGFSQDRQPYGSMVPASKNIYNPELWDSREDYITEEVVDQATNRIVEVQTPLEPGTQPLYVESPYKGKQQVRAGSPLACNKKEQCTLPPVAGGYTNASITKEGATWGLVNLRQLFAKVFGFWQWSKNTAKYISIFPEWGMDYSKDSTDAGQCPILQAVKTGDSVDGFIPVQVFDPSTSSNTYNLPITGVDCPGGPGTNMGHFSINGNSVVHANGVVSNIMTDVNLGQEISLQFYAFNYNGEQLPLKKIEIFWGPDETETVVRGNFKNHRPDCTNNGKNYGMTTKACDPRAFEFKHIYQRSGYKIPKVTITDNWEKRVSSNYTSSSGIILVNDPLTSEIESVSSLAQTTSTPSYNDSLSFTWAAPATMPPAPDDTVDYYRIVINRIYSDGRVDTEFVPQITTTNINRVGDNSDDSISSLKFNISACVTNLGCGAVSSMEVNYSVGAPTTTPALSQFYGDPYVLGDPAMFHFSIVEGANAYEFEIVRQYLPTGLTTTDVQSINVNNLSSSGEIAGGYSIQANYVEDTSQIKITVKACNDNGCGPASALDTGRYLGGDVLSFVDPFGHEPVPELGPFLACQGLRDYNAPGSIVTAPNNPIVTFPLPDIDIPISFELLSATPEPANSGLPVSWITGVNSTNNQGGWIDGILPYDVVQFEGDYTLNVRAILNPGTQAASGNETQVILTTEKEPEVDGRINPLCGDDDDSTNPGNIKHPFCEQCDYGINGNWAGDANKLARCIPPSTPSSGGTKIITGLGNVNSGTTACTWQPEFSIASSSNINVCEGRVYTDEVLATTNKTSTDVLASVVNLVNYLVNKPTSVHVTGCTNDNWAYSRISISDGKVMFDGATPPAVSSDDVCVVEVDLKHPANQSYTGNKTDTVHLKTITIENNNAPTANAGTDQTVASDATITLNGTASSDSDTSGPCNASLTYSWTKTGFSKSGSTSSFSATELGGGSHTITLTVSDGIDTNTDTVVITVNRKPTASIDNSDTTITVGDTLGVRASWADADGDSGGGTEWYESNPDFTITTAGFGFDFIPTTTGTYVFRFRASDGTEWSDWTGDLTITVDAAGVGGGGSCSPGTEIFRVATSVCPNPHVGFNNSTLESAADSFCVDWQGSDSEALWWCNTVQQIGCSDCGI